MPEHHLVLDCRCGHVDQISFAILIEVHGGDVSVHTVKGAVKSTRCKMKRVACMQIVYIGHTNGAFGVARVQRANG